VAPLRCCRRYARLKRGHDVDYRTKKFSCSVCGSEAYFCLIEPTKEFGMHDYRLDEPEQPECHGWTALKSARVSNSARRPMFHTLYVRKATFISNGLRYR